MKRWFRRKRLEADLEGEMAAHREEKIDELVEQGISEEDARSAVHRQFGNITLQREDSRAAWGWNGIEQFLKDLRFGCRLLAKSPVFTLTAFLTLAVGIGASVAVFTVVDSVLLKPLTYRRSGDLVVAWEKLSLLSSDPVGPNPRHVDVWRTGATAFEQFTLLQQGSQGVAVGNEHPRVLGMVFSEPNLFDLLQVHPLLGRSFRPDDGVKGRDHVVIVSFSLWQSLFESDRNILGKTIRIGDARCQIIGVLPRQFHFPNQNSLRPFYSNQVRSSVREPEIFRPAAIDPNDFSWSGDYGNWIALGRLNPGVSIAEASTQLASLETRVIAQMPAGERETRLRTALQPLHEVVVGDSKATLWLLMAAVFGLLLIACLNLANAQLGRAVLREREAALRNALGASKWRLLTGALAENLLLAAAGGLAGIGLAAAAVRLFQYYAPVDLPRLSEVHLNATVMAFSLLLTLGSALLFGLLPALKLMRCNPQAALQQNNGRMAGSTGGHRLRIGLIALQVFGCTVLLLFTGLFVKSLLHLLHQEKGFETERIAVAQVDLYNGAYREKNSRIAFDDTILQNLRTLPGVESAALISIMPLEGESWIEHLSRTDRPQQKTPLVNLLWVSPGYFETIRQPLVAGRFFEERDRNLNSVVLSQGEARALWPVGDALNGQIQVEGRKFNVIGIVADALTTSLKSSPTNMAYAHYKDRPPFSTFFMVRGKTAADVLLANMRRTIWSHAPDVTITRLKTLDAQLADSLAKERFETLVLLAFAGAALTLAMFGIYGVLNYAVASRRQEIGVRIALGATRLQIYVLTFQEGGIAVLGGLAAGLLASLLASGLIRKLIYGVQPIDPEVAASVAILFLTVALTAALLPARKAASLDPAEALRTE